MRVSILIVNYNYGRFLREAIDSALAQTWEDKEVIVCDDGSTDDSRQVIETYGDRIVAIFKANGGQLAAANVAFARATGDILFFLDSDDALLPEAAEEVGKAWLSEPNVTKVQFPLLTVQEDGTPTGSVYPNFPAEYSPDKVRESMDRTAFYVSSPTSGNAWSRHFLERVFPLPTSTMVKFIDGYLSTLAPLCGNVVTVAKPLARYRLNSSNMWSTRFSPELVADNCDEDIVRATMVKTAAHTLGLDTSALVPEHNYSHMMKRVVYRRFVPRYPFGDSMFGLLATSWRSVMADPNLGSMTRMLLLGWFTAVMFLPKSLALPAVKMRFVNSYRPDFINRLLAMSGWRGRHAT